MLMLSIIIICYYKLLYKSLHISYFIIVCGADPTERKAVDPTMLAEEEATSAATLSKMESPLVSLSDDSDGPDEKAGASVKARSGGNLYATDHGRGRYPSSNGVPVLHKAEAEAVQPSLAGQAVEGNGVSVGGNLGAGSVQLSRVAGTVENGGGAIDRGIGRDREDLGPVKRHIAAFEQRLPGSPPGLPAGPALGPLEGPEKAGFSQEGGAGSDGELVLEVVKGSGKQCRGMSVLPFVPVTLTFQDVCYFVDMGKVVILPLTRLAPRVAFFFVSLPLPLLISRFARPSGILFLVVRVVSCLF